MSNDIENVPVTERASGSVGGEPQGERRWRLQVCSALRIDRSATWEQILDRARALTLAETCAARGETAGAQALVSNDAKLELASQVGLLPSHLPAVWLAEGFGPAGWLYRRRGGVQVIVSAHVEGDGKLWLHVSASRRDRVPSYTELCEVKRVFVGAERMAVSVYAPETEHFNLHRFCLHLWAPIGHSPLPDFRRASGGV